MEKLCMQVGARFPKTVHYARGHFLDACLPIRRQWCSRQGPLGALFKGLWHVGRVAGDEGMQEPFSRSMGWLLGDLGDVSMGPDVRELCSR